MDHTNFISPSVDYKYFYMEICMEHVYVSNHLYVKMF